MKKRKNPVGQVLRICANAVRNEKSEMGAYFRRMKSKSGHNQAVVATAHKMRKNIICYGQIQAGIQSC